MSDPRFPDPVPWAEERLGMRFNDSALLARALTHKTMGADNYERLEFLGDRILGAAIAVQLYLRFPNEPEGRLSRRLHRLVSRETCAHVGRSLGLSNYVRLNIQARSDGGANSDNILGDVMEALIGAIFLDQGLDQARALVLRAWEPFFEDVNCSAHHPKSAVQEWALGRGLKTPEYALLHRSGPHHSPRFHVRLSVAGMDPVEAEGGSKQEAETRAAQRFLDLRRSG
jgi:ribonuclease-3